MIQKRIKEISKEIPPNVKIIAVVKTRSIQEIKEAIKSGITIIGDNYIQEAESKFSEFHNKIEWHFIGHLQRNKLKKAVKIFDVIETIDSLKTAKRLDKECKNQNKKIKIMIEINIAKEAQKNGILPKDLENFVKEILTLENLELIGLMAMGSFTQNLEISRREFKEIKKLFNKTKIICPDLKYLSMGMSSNYKIAIKEGANMIRIGTRIFGPRKN